MACLHRDCKSEWNCMEWAPGNKQANSSWETLADAADYSYPSCEIYPDGRTVGSTNLCFGHTDYDGSSIRPESISDLDLGSEMYSYPKIPDAKPDGTSSQSQLPESEFLAGLEFPELEYSTVGLDTLPDLAQASQAPTRSDPMPCACSTEISDMRLELEGLRKEIWDLRQRSDRRSDFDSDMKDVIEEVRGANEITMGNINRLWTGVENQQAWASSLSYKVKDIESFLENCTENEDVDGV